MKQRLISLPTMPSLVHVWSEMKLKEVEDNTGVFITHNKCLKDFHETYIRLRPRDVSFMTGEKKDLDLRVSVYYRLCYDTKHSDAIIGADTR